MNCPNCGAHGLTRAIKQCRACGTGFVAEDLLELEQLRFLLKATAEWGVGEELRAPYAQRLSELHARLVGRAALAPAPPAEPAAEPVATTEVRPTAAAREKAPFDQWLLSERNIKIALYSGALLLVVAALIFVGANWGRLPGPVKFAAGLLATGLMYGAGALLFRRPNYRIGGLALLGIASGFVVADLAILQIYVLRAAGLDDRVMWLIASPACLALYAATAAWTRADLFTYLGLGAAVSAVAALLAVTEAPLLAHLPALALLAYAILWLSRAAQRSRRADYTLLPTRLVSVGGMAALALASLAYWSTERDCIRCAGGSPWLPVVALALGTLFGATADALFRWLAARWAATVLLAASAAAALAQSRAEPPAAFGALLALALAYLGAGHLLERRAGRRAAGWPLYATAYALAVAVTAAAVAGLDWLDEVLFVDVVLLAASSMVHRDYRWIYGAAWLLMLPVYLTVARAVPSPVQRGLWMGLLGLGDAAAGYVLGRRSLRLGGPFLTAAACLSGVVAALTWGDPLTSVLALGAVALLYAAAALWRRWPWLLVPALAALHLLVLQANDLAVAGQGTQAKALTLSYAGLGLGLLLAGLALQRRGQARWSWPLLGAAGLDLAGSYAAALFQGAPMGIGFSATLAALLLVLAWTERQALAERRLPPLLTYAGIGAAAIGHFYVLDAAGVPLDAAWPPFTAGLSGLLVALGGLPRRGMPAQVIGTPLRASGLALMALPLAGAAAFMQVHRVAPLGWPVPPAAVLAVTFALAGLVYGLHGWLRGALWQIYLAVGCAVVALWGVGLALELREAQAFAVPPGLALLGVAWNERRRGHSLAYQVCTVSGLAVLMASAFAQSLGSTGWPYALLLLAESLAAVGLGARLHLRRSVQVGGLALLANGVAQLGPAFVRLSGWLISGLTGSILVGIGLLALFRRDAILKTRQRLAQEWKQWQP